MRRFVEFTGQNVPAEAKMAAGFVFKERDFGCEAVYLEFNRAEPLMTIPGHMIENSAELFVFE